MLTELPLEIITRIMGFSAPSHILNLRMTCRLLHKASLERSAWMNAYTRLLEHEQLPVKAHIDASLSREDLEYAAMSPILFSRSILNRPPDELPETARISILSPQEHVEDDSTSGSPVQYAELLPGGRYIFMAFDKSIEMHDLGPISAHFRPSKTLDRRRLPECSHRGFSHHFRSDHKGFIFYVMTIPDEEGMSNLRAYTIDFDQQSPKFEELSCLGLRGEAYGEGDATTDATGSLFVISTDQRVIVWNCVEDIVGEFSPIVEATRVHIANNETYLVLHHPELLQICIYGIPKLEAKPLTWQELSTTAPLSSISYPQDFISVDTLYLTPPNSHQEPHPIPTYLALMCDSGNGATVYEYETLELTGLSFAGPQSESVTIPLARLIGSYTQDFSPGGLTHLIDVISDSNMRLLIDEAIEDGPKKSIVCSVSFIGQSGARVSSPQKLLYTWTSELDTPCNWTICHMSGRLCILTDDRDLRIMDFVHPPS